MFDGRLSSLTSPILSSLLCYACSISFLSMDLSGGCTKCSVLSLCIINETVSPKQPEIQAVPKHSRLEWRGQKAYVTPRRLVYQTSEGCKNHLVFALHLILRDLIDSEWVWSVYYIFQVESSKSIYSSQLLKCVPFSKVFGKSVMYLCSVFLKSHLNPPRTLIGPCCWCK